MPASAACQWCHRLAPSPARGPSAARTPSSSAAGRSAPGAPTSCARPAWTGSSCSTSDTLGRAPAAAPPGWSAPRAAARGRCASASGPAGSTAASARSSASTPASCRRATSCPCFSEGEVAAASERMAMQHSLGLDVRWLDAAEVDRAQPDDGPRDVTSAAPIARRTATCIRRATSPPTWWRWRWPACRCSSGRSFTGRSDDVRAAGQSPACDQRGHDRHAACRAHRRPGPRGGRRAGWHSDPGRRGQAPGRRHRAAPRPCPVPVPMVFDLSAGLYWRPEDGGMLFGMSNPAEPPGESRGVDVTYLELIRERLAGLVPVTAGLELRRTWAATIDYTPDHLPIIGPAMICGQIVNGVTVASAGGARDDVGSGSSPSRGRRGARRQLAGGGHHRPGAGPVRRRGQSRLATDPIALPFPEHAPRAPDRASPAPGRLSIT